MDLRTCHQENKATICLWCLFVPGSVVSYFILFKKRFSGCSICIHTCYIYDNNWMCVRMSPCVVYRFPQRQLWWTEMWHWTSSDGIRQVITLVLRMTWDAFTSMMLERWDFVPQMLFVLTPSVCAHAGFCVAQDLPGKKKKKSSRSKYNTSTINYLFFFVFCFFVYTLT